MAKFQLNLFKTLTAETNFTIFYFFFSLPALSGFHLFSTEEAEMIYVCDGSCCKTGCGTIIQKNA